MYNIYIINANILTFFFIIGKKIILSGASKNRLDLTG